MSGAMMRWLIGAMVLVGCGDSSTSDLFADGVGGGDEAAIRCDTSSSATGEAGASPATSSSTSSGGGAGGSDGGSGGAGAGGTDGTGGSTTGGCSSCTAGQVCRGNACCTPTACPQGTCGWQSDGCNGQQNCGTTCGGGYESCSAAGACVCTYIGARAPDYEKTCQGHLGRHAAVCGEQSIYTPLGCLAMGSEAWSGGPRLWCCP